ncbi:MAG TPA: YceI family protein [Chryseolinea sp.]|nr:YceI family protein [Chryseolinea sp.]HPH47734.1 YceI family protein [Chryseolinea sp.]HPM31819.1 YceI family protein [Chryseolinea sp.]
MKLFRKSFNNSLTISFLLLTIPPLFSAYHRPENENAVSASLTSSIPVANEKYVIDKKESSVTWKCSMSFAKKGGHNGYISLSKGELTVDNGQLTSGTVEVDMNTIADEKHASDNDLIEHLKSPDFFDVEKFPISKFAIVKVVLAEGGNINVTGIMTIKGIMQTITIPAKVEVKGGVVTVNGKLTIDRTKWDITYKSGAFFADLADEAISDKIELEMKIVAKK